MVFPLKSANGTPLFPSGSEQATLTVRISNKEGRVVFLLPAYLREK